MSSELVEKGKHHFEVNLSVDGLLFPVKRKCAKLERMIFHDKNGTRMKL